MVQGYVAQKTMPHPRIVYRPHRKMRCGREVFHVRTPHWISADVNILMSAHTGFADVNDMTSAHHTPQNGVSVCASKACTSLIKNTPLVGPYSSPMPRDIW